MKSEMLHELWSSPDNSRLLSKQFSFRLPVHIAAKIAALCELYPQKNRTQIVADLLASALDDLERSLPYKVIPIPENEQRFEDEIAYFSGHEQEEWLEMAGVRQEFRAIANKHYIELEKELGNESPSDLYKKTYGTKDFFENEFK